MLCIFYVFRSKMPQKWAQSGKLRKVTTFFSYMQARAIFFIFFIKCVNGKIDTKKGDNFLSLSPAALPLGLEPRTP